MTKPRTPKADPLTVAEVVAHEILVKCFVDEKPPLIEGDEEIDLHQGLTEEGYDVLSRLTGGLCDEGTEDAELARDRPFLDSLTPDQKKLCAEWHGRMTNRWWGERRAAYLLGFALGRRLAGWSALTPEQARLRSLIQTGGVR